MAVIAGELVAVGSTWAMSERYADVAVVTAEPWRGRGLATACAALVAAAIVAGLNREGQVKKPREVTFAALWALAGAVPRCISSPLMQ